MERFPCLGLAYRALQRGGTCPAVMNAANEVAVEAFLNNTLTFPQIPQLIAQVMNAHQEEELKTIERVLQADLWGRSEAKRIISGGLS